MQEETQKNGDTGVGAAERVLLIDLENCPNQIESLPTALKEYTRIVICYANGSPKIPLEWLAPLSTAVTEDRLTIRKMPTGGKNAADFGISFFAGAMMECLPANTHFEIMSDDTDLDHVVRLLRSLGRTATRTGTQKRKQPEKPADSLAVPPDMLASIRKFCQHLATHGKNRPAKEETLINSLKSMFRDAPDHVMHMLDHLKQEGAVKFHGNKASYDERKLVALAR
jgi:hypothetical protein